jgi:hypothetical protein
LSLPVKGHYLRDGGRVKSRDTSVLKKMQKMQEMQEMQKMQKMQENKWLKVDFVR